MAVFTRTDSICNTLDTEEMTTATAFTRDHALETEDLYMLSLLVTPGNDFCSKALLRTDYIKDVIINSVVGGGISGPAYYNGPTEQNGNKRTDITYYPQDKTKSLASVIVEIQRKVTHEFIIRLMQYSLNVFAQTKILPIVIVINIDGFSSKHFRDENFTTRDNDPYYTLTSLLWSKQVHIYNTDSISTLIQVPMPNMIALIHFLTQLKKTYCCFG